MVATGSTHTRELDAAVTALGRSTLLLDVQVAEVTTGGLDDANTVGPRVVPKSTKREKKSAFVSVALTGVQYSVAKTENVRVPSALKALKVSINYFHTSPILRMPKENSIKTHVLQSIVRHCEYPRFRLSTFKESAAAWSWCRRGRRKLLIGKTNCVGFFATALGLFGEYASLIRTRSFIGAKGADYFPRSLTAFYNRTSGNARVATLQERKLEAFYPQFAISPVRCQTGVLAFSKLFSSLPVSA